jgi:hypothetical protein
MFPSHLVAPLENEDNNQANLGIYTVIYLGMNQNVFRKLALQGKKQNLELNNSHLASGGFVFPKARQLLPSPTSLVTKERKISITCGARKDNTKNYACKNTPDRQMFASNICKGLGLIYVFFMALSPLSNLAHLGLFYQLVPLYNFVSKPHLQRKKNKK